MAPDPEETSAMTPGRFLYTVYVAAGVIISLGIIAMSLSGIRVFMLNFIIGAAFSMGLVRSTQFLVQQLLTPGERLQQRRIWLIIFLLAKLPVILIFLALVAWSAWFNVTGFIGGISLMPLLIIGYSLISIFTGKNPIGQADMMTLFEKQDPLKNSVRR